MSEEIHEHDGVEHTHHEPDLIGFYGTHEHDGIEHTHDQEAEGGLVEPDESSDNVEPPAPKRQVPVIISGVNHGMRDAEEGE